LLVLAEFPEYPHLSTRAEISRLFFDQVARYFSEVSYGKLTITGNATDWITLPRLYEQYISAGQEGAILSIAQDSLTVASETFNFTSFNGFLLVMSFYPSLTADYVTLTKPIVTRTGTVNAIAAVEEDRDWSAYARSVAMMFGLSTHSSQLSGLGDYDVTSGGQGDMSTWTKVTLGWINDSQIITLAAPVRQAVLISPLESAHPDVLALRVRLAQSYDEYFLEVRQAEGYDRNSLQEYGALVLYVPSDNSSVQVKGVLRPDDVGRAIFRDLGADLSFVALNQTQAGFWILVGSVQDWRDAQRALYEISRASDAIQTAESENRIAGLDLAQRLIEKAHSLFTVGQFVEAEALALSAETTANGANVPSDYSQSVQLIAQADELKNQAQSLSSTQGLALATLGNAQLESAKQAFVAKNFTFAKQDAQTAIDLFNRAKQLDFTDRVVGILSNLALIIPVAVLVYAIRYQLKSD
jgi:hypothetical protein